MDSVECGDCGWTLRPQQLQPDADLLGALQEHGEKYCARPPYEGPYSL